jgi:hypothetical protein
MTDASFHSSRDHKRVERKPSRQRSRVSNGKSYFIEADARGAWSRRWRDLLGEIAADLGGVDLLSEAQRQLIRRAATICVQCERLEGQAAEGREIDLEVFGALTDRLGRTFHRLGLKRQARDIEQLPLRERLGQ